MLFSKGASPPLRHDTQLFSEWDIGGAIVFVVPMTEGGWIPTGVFWVEASDADVLDLWQLHRITLRRMLKPSSVV